MEFWGIEVKPGQTVKCEAGVESILHLSQASLGENKKEKGAENVPIFVKINDQKLVIGTLSKDKCAQIHYDLVFEKEFELSHGSKNTSVFFVGYKGVKKSDKPEDGFHDFCSEDDLEIDEKTNGKPFKNEQGKDWNVAAKLKATTEKSKKEHVKAHKKAEDKDLEDDIDEVEDDSEEDSNEDEDIFESSEDSSEEDGDDISEEEATTEKVETDKKRKSVSAASKTPIREKKARIVTPVENHKTGGDGKKAHVHVATPHPAKQGGKPQQSSKSSGSVACKSCNRTFSSENALQAHRKAKHGDPAK